MSYLRKNITGSHDPAYKRRKSDSDIWMKPDHFRRMLKHIKKNPANRDLRDRDYMLMVLMGNMALRVSEVAILRIDQFSGARGRVPKITVKAKKKRSSAATKTIYIHPRVLDKVKAYIKKHTYAGDEYLFIGGTGNGHLGERQISNIFNTYADGCGFREAYSTHALRHMYGVLAYERTNDLLFIRDQMGHSTMDKNLGVTDRYIHLSPKRAKTCIEKMRYIL